MVSVIVPVYNVYECIDRCMESIVNQTYKDIEIILINDGSTDESASKCEEWEKKDSRIRYISKANEGLGPTRNLGVEIARSDYIMFVDSDDWVDTTIVEKLISKLVNTDSEMAVCDRFDVKIKDNSYGLVVQDLEEVMEVEKFPQIISSISTSQWGKLYKKELFTQNGIEQPKHLYEDAITPVMAALCERICYVNEPLYYYVIDRGGSITNNIKGLDSLVEYLKTAVELFQKYGLFDKFQKNIFEMCSNRINWNMYHAERVLNHKLVEIGKANEEFVQRYWGEYNLNSFSSIQALDKQFYIWGSYNLMISMKMVMRMRGPLSPQNHYAFSSLISAMDVENGTLNQIEVTHNSEFRRNHLLKEFKRDFYYKNLGEFSDVKYFVLDFLEERFDVGEYQKKYITMSDAFVELNEKQELEIIRHRREELESENLWKNRCLNFIELIRRFFKDKKVVLVRMKLASQYGDINQRKTFGNIEWIKQMNTILDSYYSFFEKNCPEAIVVEVEDSEYFYCDGEFRHGCYPWHLNDYMYQEIKDRIVKSIWKK